MGDFEEEHLDEPSVSLVISPLEGGDFGPEFIELDVGTNLALLLELHMQWLVEVDLSQLPTDGQAIGESDVKQDQLGREGKGTVELEAEVEERLELRESRKGGVRPQLLVELQQTRQELLLTALPLLDPLHNCVLLEVTAEVRGEVLPVHFGRKYQHFLENAIPNVFQVKPIEFCLGDRGECFEVVGQLQGYYLHYFVTFTETFVD